LHKIGIGKRPTYCAWVDLVNLVDLIYMLESFMDPKSKNDPTTNQQTRKGKRCYPTSENRVRIAE